ncbi:MAG TPA: ABC transporter substrate-binding protein [Thermoplasmata archaeon]|nr:ABC transporter substrate-binding protein [Thermoplasmata archaeon]
MDPKWRNVIVLGIVAVVVVAGVAVVLNHNSTSNSTSTVCNSPLQSKNPIQVDQAEIPDSLDPAVTFSTPGWAAVQQVYQGLVNYNGTSSTNFSGVLASGWTEANNPATNLSEYTFTLRPGVTFSNGDPYNAYVQWYSFYRSLLLEQGPQFILEQNFFSTNFNASNPLSYYSPIANTTAANTTLVGDLNTWNFDTPTSTEVAAMEMPNQSFQVLNANTIRLNLGYGYLASNYTYLLASISAPNSYAVDPNVVDAHGGVSEGQVNTYLATNMVGTGQYELGAYNGVPGGGYSLTPWSGYWGSSAAASEPWNNMIQPANTTVDVVFQSSVDITTNDLKTGVAASASFAYIGPSTVSQLEGNACVVVQSLPTIYGATSGSWWIYLNQSIYPFNNLSVRAAIAHAINYQQIIDEAFGGYASQWVGPVPPSYPYYNPTGLAPYQYNLTLAQQEIANSPCANGACKGDSIKYAYLDIGLDWSETAQFLVNDLAAIGLTIDPVEISLDNLYEEQELTAGVCTTATAANGGPFPMGQEFYTSDYISPDDWTQNDAVATGSANMCMSGYNNATVNQLVYQAAAESNPANLTADYSTMTSLMYQNYTDIWLCVPTSFAIYSSSLHGVIENPMASAEPYAFLFNTQWAS